MDGFPAHVLEKERNIYQSYKGTYFEMIYIRLPWYTVPYLQEVKIVSCL